MDREQMFLYDLSYVILGGGASFIVALCVFQFIGPAMSKRFTSTYRSLPKAAKSEWGDR